MPEDIQAKFEITLLLGAISFFICFFAWRKTFFTLPSEKEEVSITFTDVFIVFVIYFFSFVFLTPIIMKLLGVNQNQFSEIFHISLTNFLGLLTVLTALCFYYFSKFKKLEKDIHLIFSNNLKKNIWVGFIGWIIAIPIVLFIHQALDFFIVFVLKVEKIPEQIAVQFLKSTVNYPISFLFAIISAVFLAPLIEELLFRGFLQTWLKKIFGRIMAILISSICFSLFHFSRFQGVGNVSILGALFPLAFFLGFIYEKQRSLIAPITLHAIFNSTSVINLIFF